MDTFFCKVRRSLSTKIFSYKEFLELMDERRANTLIGASVEDRFDVDRVLKCKNIPFSGICAQVLVHGAPHLFAKSFTRSLRR